MSLDDLITLALIALFVGLPLLQRVMGGKGAKPPEEAPGEESGAPEGRRSSRRSAERETTGRETETATGPARAQTTEASDGASELERRIEEARKRVQQARQGQSPAGRQADRAPQARADTSSRPLVKPRGAASSGGSLGREGVSRPPRDTAPSGGFLGREGVTRTPRKTAPPLQVSKRAGRRSRSKMSGASVVSLEPDDIMRGIVWHQILSEPVSARKRRRRPSRDR